MSVTHICIQVASHKINQLPITSHTPVGSICLLANDAIYLISLASTVPVKTSMIMDGDAGSDGSSRLQPKSGLRFSSAT